MAIPEPSGFLNLAVEIYLQANIKHICADHKISCYPYLAVTMPILYCSGHRKLTVIIAPYRLTHYC